MAAMIRKTCSGMAAFTLAEMLIALVIMAILLTAIATAFNASAMNYRENAGIAEAMNSARNALARMTTTIRTCNWVDITGGTTSCVVNVLGVIDSTGDRVEWIEFQYDIGTQTLKQITTRESGATTTNDLCRSVTLMNFSKTNSGTAKDEDGVSYPCNKSVVISMTIQIGDVTETFTSAAVVRKNL